VKLAAFEVAVDISAEGSPQTKELNIVGLDEAKRTKIVQFFLGKSKCAEMVNLCVDFFAHLCRELDILITAFKQIYSVEIGVFVEHYLVHIEFIEVGIKQRYDTRG
jgi:hypothetical protein